MRRCLSGRSFRPLSLIIPVLFAVLFLVPSRAHCLLIDTDTTWSGMVHVTEDILVPQGVTLTIAPGTNIQITPAESTKTDPEFLSPLREITVRGRLRAEGTDHAQISFAGTEKGHSRWAGIIVDGGTVSLRSCTITDAETGITSAAGSVNVSSTIISGNRYGMVVLSDIPAVRVSSSSIDHNEYGLFLLNGANIGFADSVVKENRKKDRYEASAKSFPLPPSDVRNRSDKKGVARVYRDEVLMGTVQWQGRIEVQGVVRVPEQSRLIILPGTIVEVRRKDTNSDGIGENGLLVQGVIIAKGTPEKPILFRSGEKKRSMGDWDSINIMNSDRSQNLIEYCRIEDAYRGLHFHFSQVAVTNTVLRNNYRGIQFQESVVEIRNSTLSGNKSAFQARDSEILFTGNIVAGNYTGMNLLRDSATVRDNVIVNNLQEGLRVREGLPLIEANLVAGNRHGMMITDGMYGTFSRNAFMQNTESGISLRGTDTIEISGNVIQANGLNGISLQESNASILGNLITDNGERGIGAQSFQGSLTGNSILRNGLYNLGIEGPGAVAAPMNWWGNGDPKRTISDGETDPAKGRADYVPFLSQPALFTWPLGTISSDTRWYGRIGVNGHVSVEPGAVLEVFPGTAVLFGKGGGMSVHGKIVAAGEKNLPVTFSSPEGDGSAEWDEIVLDHAPGSMFVNCRFENGTWALHSHFTDLVVDSCVFRNNTGGLRFTSGPVSVRQSLFERNQVGIRAYRGTARITENTITGNDVGIFVREKGAGLLITKNNLAGNREYTIRNGDFNDEDVNARENWWGAGDPGTRIYDARNEPGIGRVRYRPYAHKPFSLNMPVQDRSEPGVAP